MNTIISELFNTPETKKFFKRLPAKVAGASNVYLIKMNYNYSNQNAYSYLNGCVFKCDSDTATCDDIDILIDVLPNITYSTKLIECAKKQFKYYDGTWFRLYWNKYLNEWKIATSQLVNGEIATWNNVAIGKNFQVFVDTLDKESLNKESTYFFIYSHPFITFDPQVDCERIQYIAEVNNGVIVENDIFKTNDEPIDESCNVIQMTDNAVNMVIQNELYQQIKDHFRVDLNTVFLNFYAKPIDNDSIMKLFFDVCPRFVQPFHDFVDNPMLEHLVRKIVSFTNNNITKYFGHMRTPIERLDPKTFKIWCAMLMRVDPNHKWDYDRKTATPFTNMKQMNVECVKLLTNEVYVREKLCDLPIADVMAALM